MFVLPLPTKERRAEAKFEIPLIIVVFVVVAVFACPFKIVAYASDIFVFMISCVQYVGRSVDIARRLKEHARIKGEIVKYIRIALPPGVQPAALEQFFIRLFSQPSG